MFCFVGVNFNFFNISDCEAVEMVHLYITSLWPDLTSFLMFLLIILYLKISGNKYYKILNNRKLMVQCIHEPQKSVLKFQVKDLWER